MFHTVLLRRCQQEFEFDHTKAIADIRSNTELETEEGEKKEIIAMKRFTGGQMMIP